MHWKYFPINESLLRIGNRVQFIAFAHAAARIAIAALSVIAAVTYQQALGIYPTAKTALVFSF